MRKLHPLLGSLMFVAVSASLAAAQNPPARSHTPKPPKPALRAQRTIEPRAGANRYVPNENRGPVVPHHQVWKLYEVVSALHNAQRYLESYNPTATEGASRARALVDQALAEVQADIGADRRAAPAQKWVPGEHPTRGRTTGRPGESTTTTGTPGTAGPPKGPAKP